jgi:hypothetical protein
MRPASPSSSKSGSRYFNTLQLEDAVVDAEQASARIHLRCGDHVDELIWR